MRKFQPCLPLLCCIALCLSGCSGQAGPEASAGKDLLAGTSWISADDGSQWVFGEDQSFYWYQTKDVTDDNYYGGTYECHAGRDGMDYLTGELASYGVSEEEMMSVIDSTEQYTLDKFICFSTTNKTFLLNGKEQLSDEVVTSYFGFLQSDGSVLDVANMSTGTYYRFTKE